MHNNVHIFEKMKLLSMHTTYTYLKSKTFNVLSEENLDLYIYKRCLAGDNTYISTLKIANLLDCTMLRTITRECDILNTSSWLLKLGLLKLET